MVVKYTKDFVKDSKRLTVKHKEQLKIRLRLFEKDKFNPSLNNHALRGKYSGYRSINITGDLRAIYQKNNDNILFVTVDSHSNLYR